MATIGTLGEVVFEVSDNLIRTFDDYARKASARIASHEIIGQKPVLEFLGPSANELSIQIRLNAFYGISPKVEADRLRRMCESGEAVQFVLGGRPVSPNLWLIETVDEKANAFDGHGNILTSELGLSLKEYVLGGESNASV